MNRPLLLSLPLLVALPCAAPAAETSREVRPAGSGPQRLELDAELFSASAHGDLADLRLRDAAGREVPYLIVPPAAPEGAWMGAKLLPVRATKKESGFEADLGAARTVARVRLDGLPEPFLKRYRLEASGDRARWTVLVAEGTLFALPDEQLRQTEVAFEPGEYRYLRVTWDDSSSARVGAPRALEAWVPSSGRPSPPPPRVPLGVARRESEPGVSRFSLRLPGPRLPVVAIVLEVKGDRVHRSASVSEARLDDGQLAPRVLGSALLQRVVRDGTAAAALRIPIDRPEELELELSVEDGDNAPLELTAAWAEPPALPWIYFESADGQALRAVAGDPERRAPAYDLEALRPKLPAVRTSGARLAPPVSASTTPSPAVAAPGALAPGGPVDPSAFRWRRPIAPAEPGLSAVRLDAAVLARSPGLADLRIEGPGARQVPYLLERRDEPLSIALAAPSPASEPKLARKGTTLLAVELPEAGLPEARLVLETPSRVFEREVELYADDDGKERTPPRLLASARWVHALPERPAPALTIALPPVPARRLFLLVHDGDNAPLPIASARLLLPSWRLRFFHPGAPLQLLYGARDVSAPRYDLALLAPRLRSAPAREVELGGATVDAGPPPAQGQQGRTAFWIALAVAVVALLALLAKLLSKGGDTQPPPAP